MKTLNEARAAQSAASAETLRHFDGRPQDRLVAARAAGRAAYKAVMNAARWDEIEKTR